ncbi:MAG: RICIN domain-containing protein [Oscillospiraceae bacterium]|nr:RICIN domain-containing protein [Oscillospiraceae bacterium]
MKLVRRITSAVMSFMVAVTAAIPNIQTASAADYSMNSGNTVVENLNRGISAINTGNGMLVSWRNLANDSNDAVYKLYRDNTLIYTSEKDKATCFLDSSGNASSLYKVEYYAGGKLISSENCSNISSNNYLQVKLDKPKGQTSGVTYSPNDCTVGDVDGDGEYEIFVKWDPSNSKDNSQKGKTDKVFIDCYKLNGKKLWRIDLGVNIRAGAHYTQMLVADFDSDGKAELTCKTADGTVDGTGVTIGDGSKDYRNSNGYILTGNEYYTLFDGATGKALDTVNYNPPRGTVKSWGDSYGNRVDRFLGSVVYLDGVHPSAVTVRGYYTRMTACAYDVKNKKLVQRWFFDTGNNSSAAGYGDGNHNCMPADVDGDGKQELVMGSSCIDDNGKSLWNYNKGHGDAMHVGDFLPDREGLEVWICHEDKPYGVTLLDGKNGKAIFHYNGDGDTGRCCADNVWSGNDGAEFWGLGNTVYNGEGKELSCRRPAVNFLSYWDGDLEREILDGYTDSTAKVTKMGADGKLTQLMETTGFYTCNTTKGTPCLSADILGDWREEIVVRAADGNSLGIFCTPYTTDYRITTLMHDVQYRTQVSAQNSGYNQPPHASFYLGSEKSLPARSNVTVLNGDKKPSEVEPTTPTEPPKPEAAVLKEGGVYTIKNQNSGMYLAAEEDKNGTNVSQKSSDEITDNIKWKAFSDGNGYYYLRNEAGSQSFVLNVAGNKSDNGTNVVAYVYKDSADNEKFKFIKNDDGTYKILTKISGDKSCVEVINADKTDGANVQQWEINGASCQNWILEETTDEGCAMATDKTYMFKNVNSGLYMNVESGKSEVGTNIQQWGGDTSVPETNNSFTLKEFTGGKNYYYIMSRLGDGKSFCLKPETGDKGGNISLSEYTTKDSSQLFRFIKNLDGTYLIQTHASRESCVVEIENADKSSGGNVQQYSPNGNDCQKWNADIATIAETEPATTTPTTTVTTTVATTETTTTTTTTEEVATTETPVVTTTVVTTITTAPIVVTTTIAKTTIVTTAKPIETTTVTEPTVIDDIVYGDVNVDGSVTIADAVLLNKYLVNSAVLTGMQLKNADVYKNGSVNSADTLAILKFIVGTYDKLPFIE